MNATSPTNSTEPRQSQPAAQQQQQQPQQQQQQQPPPLAPQQQSRKARPATVQLTPAYTCVYDALHQQQPAVALYAERNNHVAVNPLDCVSQHQSALHHQQHHPRSAGVVTPAGTTLPLAPAPGSAPLSPADYAVLHFMGAGQEVQV